MVSRDPVFHQPVGQGQVQGGAVRFTQESGTSLAAQVGRDAVLCGSKGVCFITLGASHHNGFSWRNSFVTMWKGISSTQGWGLERKRSVLGSRVTMSFEPSHIVVEKKS